MLGSWLRDGEWAWCPQRGGGVVGPTVASQAQWPERVWWLEWRARERAESGETPRFGA